MSFEEGPLYYREIQKNAYLKRVPNETTGSKLLQLGYKKVPPKPMWTLFCIHNGRTPYLEQYIEASSPGTLSHKPVWSACLRSARHVTASVQPRAGGEYDFLIDTDHGSVRMIASDWDTMQDWVSTLRNKLHELKILSSGENVYCAAPAAPAPRAPARDPTSPLPPTPSVPPDRVPGIELIPPRPPPEEATLPPEPPPEPVDISNWEEDPQPSTSTMDQPQSVAKICGQNICLDDSILRRRAEDFFDDEEDNEEYRQTVKVEEASEEATCEDEPQATNITVIQVSNKNPPHTAIPVLGPETDVFNFDFNEKVNLTVNDKVTIEPDNSFVNIVNTEDNAYGAVFNNGEYGHLSLTTTVNLNDSTVNVTNAISNNDTNTTNEEIVNQESLYERMCMASTSNDNAVARVKNTEKLRKSSLPNLDTANDSTYEYLFPNNNGNSTRNDVVNGRNGNRQEARIVNVYNNSVPNRVVRTNIERSQSQSAYDSSERVRERLIRPNRSPKRDGKTDKPEPLPAKPIWKRGLTEFSLLTKLIGGKRHDSPSRQEPDVDSPHPVTSPVKVVRRSRPEARIDGARRRSSSLNNGQPPSAPLSPPGPLQPLRARQAAALQAEQRRGAAVAASVSVRDPPTFVDYDHQVWICNWGNAGRGVMGRAGDRVAAVRRQTPRNAQHATQLVKQDRTQKVDILFHRVPLGKIYVLNRRDNESLGIKLDSECNIVSVERGSLCSRLGLPPAGRWAVTEVNNRPLNLLKGGEEEMLRLSMHGSEVSVLIQPSALVKKMRSALKANKYHIR